MTAQELPATPPLSSAAPTGARRRPRDRRRTWLLAGVVLLTLSLVLAGYEVERESPPAASTACPLGSSPLQGEPNSTEAAGWVGEARAMCVPWTDGKVPVVYFVAAPLALAGPEGSSVLASGWTLEQALSAFGVLLAPTYATSNPDSAYPNTPGLNLSGPTLTSPFVAWENNEGPGAPPLGSLGTSCLARFDPADSVPFLIVGGLYFAFGLLPPGILSGLSPQEVAQNLTAGTGPVYQAVNASASYLEAYLWKVDALAGISPPPQVEADPVVAGIERSIL